MRTFIVLFANVVAWCAPVFADDGSLEEFFKRRAVLGSGQVVQGDYFAFGPHVEVSGTVNGDVYAAGGEVLVDGTINGDLIVAGGKVTISGTVSQDARIAGGQVTLGGTIGRNVTVGGGDVQVTESASVRENLLVGGGNVQLAGQIGRDVRAGAGNVTLSNKIGGDLAVAAAAIRLTSKASVGKNVTYWSETHPSIDEKATVMGTVTKRPIPEAFKGEKVRRGVAGIKLVAGMVSFASTLLLGLLLLRIYPVFTLKAATTIQERPWISFGAGGAVLAGTPFLVLFCMATVLGIPIGLMLGALYLVTLYLGRVFVMLWVGQRIVRRLSDSPSLSWAFVTGLIVYSLVSLIPLIGKLATLFTLVAGLGALLITKKELVVKLREQQMA